MAKIDEPAKPYLEQELDFLPDRIEVRDGSVQVMMAWELPLMRRMAEIVTTTPGDVLEIGFGMGLSCDEIQKRNPKSHTIVEAHPQIYERAVQWAADKPNTRIIKGRWQDCIAQLKVYDGISFDVFGGEGQRERFFSHLGTLLRLRGVATLWLADDQDLPHELQRVLKSQGFTYQLTRVTAIPSADCRYSRTNTFTIPVISRRLA